MNRHTVTNVGLQRASVAAAVQWHRFGEDWCASVEASEPYEGGSEQRRIAAAARELAALTERVRLEVEEITKRHNLPGWSGTVDLGTTKEALCGE